MTMQTVETSDGIRIPYVVQGDGTGPHLVFAHGLMGTGAIQRAQLSPLVDAGWTVVTFDQRGHADATPIVDAAGFDAVAMGNDLWAVADAAGIDRCWIGGGSMGAATSFRAAVSRPERVEGLVQAVPALRDEPHPMVWGFDAIADVLHDAGMDGFIQTLRRLTESMSGRVDETFLDEVCTHDPASLETALRAVPRWILDDVPSAFASLRFPVVVMGWNDDPIHPLETAKDLAAAAGVELIQLDQATALAEPTTLGRVLVEQLAGARA
jgi:pimeloyl-ACP methyl ester carboxylesterase